MHRFDDSPSLGSRTWTTVDRGILFVPLGSTEQHGPHLPLHTDTTVAGAVAVALAERFLEAGIPAIASSPLPYGASGEHEGFAGTLSMGTETLARVLVEVGRSASRWADWIVFVNGHGGNLDAIRSAVELLRAEDRDATWVPCAAPTGEREPDAHAGWVETSLMLHLAPEEVRVDRAVAGERRPLTEVMPQLRSDGVGGVAPNGVLGDPAGASAEEGRRLFDAMCDSVWKRVTLTCGLAADTSGESHVTAGSNDRPLPT